MEISSNTTISDPEITSALNNYSVAGNISSTTLSSSNTSVFQNAVPSADIQTSTTRTNTTYFYGNRSSLSTATLQGQNASYSISVLDAFLSLSRNGVTFGGQGSGMSYSFGIAFFTSSTSTSSPFHVSSANTISNFQNPASAGTSTLSSGTVTKSGSFTWPSQDTVYIRGYIKSVNIGGIITDVSAEPGTTVTATLRPPRANVNTSDILTAITKSEFNAGGLLVAKNSTNYFRINRNGSNSYTNPLVTSKGVITHYGNIGIGGNIKLGVPGGLSNNSSGYAMIQHSQATTSALLLRNYSTGGIHFRNSTNSLSLSINNDRSITFNDYGSGTLTSNNSGLISSSSDGSLKDEVIQDIPGLSEVLRLNPKAYIWKNDTQSMIEIGFFANEVKDVIPEAAPLNNNGLYGLLDRGIIAALVKGMKEQQAIIESQKTLIDNLTERVTALEG